MFLQPAVAAYLTSAIREHILLWRRWTAEELEGELAEVILILSLEQEKTDFSANYSDTKKSEQLIGVQEQHRLVFHKVSDAFQAFGKAAWCTSDDTSLQRHASQHVQHIRTFHGNLLIHIILRCFESIKLKTLTTKYIFKYFISFALSPEAIYLEMWQRGEQNICGVAETQLTGVVCNAGCAEVKYDELVATRV